MAWALGAFALSWLEYQYLVHVFPRQFCIVLIATGLPLLGIWMGHRLTSTPCSPRFARNEAAAKSLGPANREAAVLDFLSTGQTNKQIARTLGNAPDTIKTHVANILRKLNASTRAQAIARARELSLIP